MKNTRKITFLVLISVLLSSCSMLKPIRPLNKHQAKVILKNKKTLNGKTTITKSKKVKINNQKFASEDVEKVIIYNPKRPSKQYELDFEKIKVLFGNSNYWVLKTGAGKFVNSYIGAVTNFNFIKTSFKIA